MNALAITGRDLTVRVRSAGAARTVIALAVVLGATVLTMYRIATTSRRGTTGVSALVSTGVGREVVHLTLFVLLVVFCVAIPITAGAAIAGERERGSLGPLLLSGVHPLGVVAGKTLASVASMAALVALASPFLAIGYLLGGVTGPEVFRGLAMLLLSAWMLTTVCLAVSAGAPTAAKGIIRAGMAVLALVVGTVMALGLESVVARTTDFGKANRAVLMANPFAATADVVAGRSGGSERFPSPFTPFHTLIGDRTTLLNDLNLQSADPNGFGFPRSTAVPVRLATARSTPFYQGAIGVDLALILIGLVAAARRLRLPQAGLRP
jgi:ABC-type transport system involved in multi-copper enzyme maturation permease subunit